MKILIIDDDEDIVDSISEFICESGFPDIEKAFSGQEGYQKFLDCKPEIVLSDIEMPNGDGLEMLEKIRLIDSNVIVIMFTGYGSEEKAVKALELHANNYLRKPFQFEQLLMLINKYWKIIEQKAFYKSIRKNIITNDLTLRYGNDLEHIPELINFLIIQCGINITSEVENSVRHGLLELLINSIEHGNLEISYEEKTDALEKGHDVLQKLYEERRNQSKYKDRFILIKFNMNDSYLEWIITDNGNGFDYNKIKNPLTEGVFELHGRGIFLSKFQFDELEYFNGGRIVRARKYKPGNSN